jgi:16S rRNA G966 N2-methylase RsmD
MPHQIGDELKIIRQYLGERPPEENHRRPSIMDATANCGATAISVAVELGVDMIAIELDPPTCDVLRRNVSEFAGEFRGDVFAVCGNSLEFLKGFKGEVDIILIDAPWGGHGYTEVKNLMLYMKDETGESVPLYDVANLAFVETNCHHVILKVPRNFDMAAFTRGFRGSYDLHHMLRKFAPKPGQSVIDYNLIACRR